MNCSDGIGGADFKFGDGSDVDIETITDTAWSVEMPRHSIQAISSAIAPISTEPLMNIQFSVPRNNIPIDIPITRSYRIKRMPSGKSGKISVSQALRVNSRAENSAARCFVILGKEPKLLSDKKLTKARSPPKYTQVHNSVRCHISAATSATTTVSPPQLARRTYIRNPAVRAIDKEGSYQHYLHRKIKRLISTIATYAQNMDREIRLHHFSLDSYISDFYNLLTYMKSKVDSNGYGSRFKLLSSKFYSSNEVMIKRSVMMNSILKSYIDDLLKKITLLNSKIALYAHDLGMQITLMNSKINSFVDDVRSKTAIFNSKSQPICLRIKREHERLMSERKKCIFKETPEGRRWTSGVRDVLSERVVV